MDVENIKKIAVMYKNIFIEEGPEAYAKRYKQDVDYEIFTIKDLVLIQILSEVYIDLAQNNVTRQEASKRQKEIFMKFNPDDDFFGLNGLSWKSSHIKEAVA